MTYFFAANIWQAEFNLIAGKLSSAGPIYGTPK